MTISDVIDYIDKNSVAGDWKLRGGEIEFQLQQCPLCWLADKLDKNPKGATYYVWDTDLDLTQDDMSKVVAAVDRMEYDEIYSEELRQQFLKACKLC